MDWWIVLKVLFAIAFVGWVVTRSICDYEDVVRDTNPWGGS